MNNSRPSSSSPRRKNGLSRAKAYFMSSSAPRLLATQPSSRPFASPQNMRQHRPSFQKQGCRSHLLFSSSSSPKASGNASPTLLRHNAPPSTSHLTAGAPFYSPT